VSLNAVLAATAPLSVSFKLSLCVCMLCRRFVLKDSIYRQRIRALAVLTERMLKHYVECGVSYVEFSVSTGDLFERPWIYKQLVASKVDHIEYNFLGAFPRDRITFTEKTVDASGCDALRLCCCRRHGVRTHEHLAGMRTLLTGMFR
jgi:hypothetical protein